MPKYSNEPGKSRAVSKRQKLGGVLRLGLVASLTTAAVTLPVASHAQATATGSISGRVQNAHNGSYLNNARITVEGTSIVVFTNSFGEFRLEDIPAGTVTLNVFYTGLEPRSIPVTVTAGERAEPVIRLAGAGVQTDGSLDDDVIQLNVFTVTTTKDTDAASIATNEQRFASNIKNVVSADAFGDVTEGNIGEFVKFLPGISVDYVAADVRTISVRGFADNFTAVAVDGAQMASSASSSNSRSFELEQVSINNVSRIEVAKVPTPSDSAATLGGSVNMISRSAFERDRASFTYKAYLSINDENLNIWEKTPGPGKKETYKALPGFEFSYINPLSKKLGIVINGLSSNQFNEQHRSQPTWRTTPIAGTTVGPSSGYLRNYQLQDGPKNTFRDSISFKVDWKPLDRHVVSFGYQFNYYKSFFGNRNINWDVGTNPTPTGGTDAFDYSPTHSYSASGRGSVTQGYSFRDKMGATNAFNATWRYDGRRWQMDAGVNYSKSKNWYRDTDRDHFETITNLQMIGESRVLMHNIDSEGPASITVLAANGTELDAHNISNYQLQNNGIDGVRSRQVESSDIISGARFNARYDLDLAVPFGIKGGVLFHRQERDIVRPERRWRYLGPDLVANSGDESVLPFMDTSYGVDPGWGYPSIQWMSPFKLYDRYKTNPEQFQEDVVGNATRLAQNSYFLQEDITAAYISADTKLMHGRLRILGGVRYEKTEDSALGQLYNADTGVRVVRGASAKTDYDGFYPSLHITFDITPNLILRAAYAKTFGRPDLPNILPSTEINEYDTTDPDYVPGGPPGYLSIRNTGLKPWQGNNYDITLEYYTDSGGIISAGVFRKEVDGFFSSARRLATAADLAPFGLGPEYVGWELRSTINAGDAKINGVELNFNQRLDIVTKLFDQESIGRMFTLYANVTKMDLSGTNVYDFPKWIDTNGNVGLNFAVKKFSAQIKWNYRGAMRRQTTTSGDLPSDRLRFDGMSSQAFWDLNLDYRFSQRFALFLNGRNIFDKGHVATRYSDNTVDYATIARTEKFGVQWALGVKGSF